MNIYECYGPHRVLGLGMKMMTLSHAQIKWKSFKEDLKDLKRTRPVALFRNALNVLSMSKVLIFFSGE